jgi:hypothetical protein
MNKGYGIKKGAGVNRTGTYHLKLKSKVISGNRPYPKRGKPYISPVGNARMNSY